MKAVHAALTFQRQPLEFLKGRAAEATVPHDWSGWVRLNLNDDDCTPWLEKLLPDLAKPILWAMTADETRPRIDAYGDGLLLIMRAANLNDGKKPHDMVSMRIWADEKRLVIVQRQRIRALEDVQDMIGHEGGPSTTGALLGDISQKIIDRLDPVLSDLEEALFILEENIMDNPDPDLRPEITRVRKETSMFRRYIAPQREVLVRLKTLSLPWVDMKDQMIFIDTHDHLTRFVENLDTIRERCQIIYEELTSTLSEQLNERMYILAIVSIVFLPLGFLTGLLGVNLSGIPGADSPYAFDIFIGVLAVLIVGSVVFLRSKRWF